MEIRIIISLADDSLADGANGGTAEAQKLIRHVSDQMQRFWMGWRRSKNMILDANGNVVGSWEITE
jgi:hypothetical protein